ncbi:uncharacterized protein LODBEIA_P17770 [Lodderomyces beijingensis]|uniref:Oxidant-induced cell-cycle arrest protein 5 n=1 Tax=Lodderomyces beijingensis TaxID=1775926 RepID=A0ABP0ZHB3_9ASCO
MSKENETILKVLLTIDKYKGNLDNFRKAVTDGDYTFIQQPRLFSRLLLWKTCLITGSLKISTWSDKLNDSRIVFHQLITRDDMRIPWHSLDQDSAYYQSRETTRKSSINHKSALRGTKSLKRKTHCVHVTEDPLSETTTTGDGSDNKTVPQETSDLELLECIILDIERLFPGEPFFHDLNNPNTVHIRRQLIEILFVWSKCNPEIGYKQGLHEILGLIYWNLYKESINYDVNAATSLTKEEQAIVNLYNKNFLCHDMFVVFNKFVLASGIATNFYESETRLSKSFDKFNIYLMKVDQFIHYTLTTKLNLESQLWIIKFLRLVLLRELGNDLETTNFVWDKLIATQSHHKNTSAELSSLIEILYFMIIQLLIQQKVDIVTSDFSDCLSLLLHYPIPKFASPTQREAFVNNLYHDATKLYARRKDDLKLYEYGMKLNNKYNPGLKIGLSYHKNGSNLSVSSTPRSSIESLNSVKNLSLTPAKDPSQERAEKMKFEKMRMEMRLKKKAQSMVNSSG